jgi:hypothetical protein
MAWQWNVNRGLRYNLFQSTIHNPVWRDSENHEICKGPRQDLNRVPTNLKHEFWPIQSYIWFILTALCDRYVQTSIQTVGAYGWLICSAPTPPLANITMFRLFCARHTTRILISRAEQQFSSVCWSLNYTDRSWFTSLRESLRSQCRLFLGFNGNKMASELWTMYNLGEGNFT